MRGGPPLDLKTVYSFQLMRAKFEYDGALNPAFREGEFELPLQRISGGWPLPLGWVQHATPLAAHAAAHQIN